MLWLAASAFILELPYGEMIELMLATLVMLSAVVAVGVCPRTLVITLLLVAPAATCRWIHYMRPDLLSLKFHAVGGAAVLAFVVAQFLRFILRAPRVDAAVLCA